MPWCRAGPGFQLVAAVAPSSQTRFRFTVDDRQGNSRRPSIGTDAVPATSTFKVTAEVWMVKFEQLKSPTLITTTGGRDIFSHGRFWIEPVAAVPRPSRADRLRERYTVKALQAQQPAITGQATYSNFRRFEVSVDQKIGPIQ